ncbi:MAG: radical SAM protein [Candidatus Diapherotrites archaeon]
MLLNLFKLNGEKIASISDEEKIKKELEKAKWLYCVRTFKGFFVNYNGVLGRFYFFDEEAYNKLGYNYDLRKVKMPKVDASGEEYLYFGISLTSKCNLACKYCFGKGGRRKGKTADWQQVKASIDYISKINKDKPVRLNLLSTGELGCDFALLKKTLAYAKKKIGKRLEIYTISTNGVISDRFCKWLVKNIPAIQLSFDGPPEIQDATRPLRDGSASSPYVEKTLKNLIKYKAKFQVRASLTKQFIENIEYAFNYFHRLGVKTLVVFPLKPIGGAEEINLPTIEEYKQATLKMLELNDEFYGFDLHTGVELVGPDFQSGYCALGRSFNVSLDGMVTSCLMYTDEKDRKILPGIENFIFGYYDSKKGMFFIDDKKRAELKEFPNKVFCHNCDFKLCRGLCPYVNLHDSGNIYVPSTRMCNMFTERYKTLINYQFDKVFVKIRPYIAVKDKKLFYVMRHKTIELSTSLEEINSSGFYLTIDMPSKIPDLKKVAKKIIDINNMNLSYLKIFLINFEFENFCNFYEMKKLNNFLSRLKSSQVFFKVVRPIRPFFSKELCRSVNKLEDKFKIPKDCYSCLELFRVLRSARIRGCSGIIGPKIDKFDCRDDIKKYLEGKNLKPCWIKRQG